MTERKSFVKYFWYEHTNDNDDDSRATNYAV